MKPHNILYIIVFTLMGCQFEDGCLKSYLQNIYPGSDIKILQAQKVDSVYSCFGKLVHLEYQMKIAKQKFSKEVQHITESNFNHQAWMDNITDLLHKTDEVLNSLYQESKKEVEWSKNNSTAKHLKVNAAIIKAISVINNDTIADTYFLNKEGKKIVYSMTHIHERIKIIENVLYEWNKIAHDTEADLKFFL